jgi:hypothetical protein
VLHGDNGGPEGGPEFQNLQFFGLVNSVPFSTVELTFTNPSGLTGMIFLDRLEYAAVPEPSALALLALGLLGRACYGKNT